MNVITSYSQNLGKSKDSSFHYENKSIQEYQHSCVEYVVLRTYKFK